MSTLPAMPSSAALTGCALDREGRRGDDLAMWLYKGVLTHVQSIPWEDRKTLFAHRLKGNGQPHPLEGHNGVLPKQ